MGSLHLRSPRHWRPRTRRLLILGPLVVLGLAVAALAVAYSRVEVLAADEVALPEATLVYYDDGRTEMLRRGTNRTSVPLQKVPEHVRHAVLAAEDHRYYREPGISVSGVVRAAWTNLRGGEISQGGSTITQQYARAQYLTQERSFSRKLREVLIAVKLDRTYSKDQVLQHYLNTIYFGRNAYGIDAAAEAYFDRPASTLTPEQGAVLAGLIKAPSVLDPRVEPKAADRRFRQVLRAMRDNGWYRGDPSRAALPTTRSGGDRPADLLYLEQQVRRELRALKIDPDQPGLRVTTTIDHRAQNAARASVADVLADVPKSTRVALVTVEPGTGAVKASYGGRTYDDRQALDGVWQERRQPGSTFKPVTLAAALESGIGLRSRYDGADDKKLEGYPEGLSNFADRSFGQIDLLEATAKSVNTVYVPLGMDAGLKKVVATAHRVGIPDRTKLEAVPSISLGTQFVRPVDMADVFATFAAGGKQADPYLVTKVTRGDDTLYQRTVKAEQAIGADVAADVSYALQGVLSPKGTAARAALPGRPAAGKTGTTTDNTAAWFVGYTPQLSTAVALFGPRPADRLRIDGVREVTGGSFPARLWNDYMTAALEGAPAEAFPPPAYVGTDRNVVPSPQPSAPQPKKPEKGPGKDEVSGDAVRPGKGNGKGRKG